MMDALQSYDWPGNVRELENVIERSLILSPGTTLVLSGVPGIPAESSEAPDAPLPEKLASDGSTRLEEVERKHILRVLEQAGWRVKGPQGAASFLGLKPSTLNSKMKKLGIERPTTTHDHPAA